MLPRRRRCLSESTVRRLTQKHCAALWKRGRIIQRALTRRAAWRRRCACWSIPLRGSARFTSHPSVPALRPGQLPSRGAFLSPVSLFIFPLRAQMRFRPRSFLKRCGRNPAGGAPPRPTERRLRRARSAQRGPGARRARGGAPPKEHSVPASAVRPSSPVPVFSASALYFFSSKWIFSEPIR